MATDRIPLLCVFEKSFVDIQNPRLLSLVEKTLWFKFKVVHAPSKVNSDPDYMSGQGGNLTTNDARLYCLHAMSSRVCHKN